MCNIRSNREYVHYSNNSNVLIVKTQRIIRAKEVGEHSAGCMGLCYVLVGVACSSVQLWERLLYSAAGDLERDLLRPYSRSGDLE